MSRQLDMSKYFMLELHTAGFKVISQNIFIYKMCSKIFSFSDVRQGNTLSSCTISFLSIEQGERSFTQNIFS